MYKQLFKLFFRTTRQTFKETTGLVMDAKKLGFEKFKISVLGRKKVLVNATKEDTNLTCELNIAENKMVQKEVGYSYVFSTPYPHQQCTKITKGDLRGNIARVKSVDLRRNNVGNFIETTQIQDFKTGNTYKRVKTDKGSTYYKQFGETCWQPLFQV